MPTGKRNLLLKILIVLISITLFGFQNMPDTRNNKLDYVNGPILAGWVDVIIYAQYSWNAGTSFYNVLEGPVEVFLPITNFDSQGRAILRGQADTLGRTNSTISGVIFQMAAWPVHWNIKGTLSPPPECALDLVIDETWFPGFNIACESTGIVGCVSEKWPSMYNPGLEINIPFSRAYGDSKPSLDGRFLTVIVDHLSLGGEDLGCEHHLRFPVIPQAP